MQHHAIDHRLTLIHWLLIIICLLTFAILTCSCRSRIHKQPPQVFLKFCKFHKEVPVLESLFYKVASLQACNVIKRDSYAGAFLWNMRNSQEQLLWRTSVNDCFCVLITSTWTDFYNSLQCMFFIFTNNFLFITQLKQ